jgi:hypothetical protein
VALTDMGAEQVANIGAPPHLNEIVWLNPPAGVIVIAYVDVAPAVIVVVVGDAESEKSATVCVRTGEVPPAKFASPP